MGLVSYIQAALTLVLAVLTILVFAAVRAVRGDVHKLLDAFRKGHGGRYSDPTPTAAAVAQGPSSGERATSPGQLPEPVLARVAVGAGLPSVERHVVPVTRDDDPIHTRPTVAEGDAEPSSDQRVVPFDIAMNRSIDRAARAARPDAPQADLDDHDTPEDETHIFSGDPDAADAQIPGVPVVARVEPPPCAPTPRTGTPIPPRPVSAPPPPLPEARRVPPSMDERIADRYNELCDASNAAGEPADHCEGAMCMKGEAVLCRCRCKACRTALAFLFQAQDENPHPTPTPTR